MLESVVTTLAKQLASENKVISLQENTILEELELNNSDEHIANIAGRIAEKMNNELILVKNKIRPFMEEYIAEVEKTVGGIKVDSELTKYTIVVHDYPKVMEELISNNVISSPRPVGKLPNGSAELTTPPVETIREIFSHTNASVNVYAKSILDKYTNEQLVVLFEKYFKLVSESNPAVQQLDIEAIYNVDEVILIYIACDRLIDSGGLNEQQALMINGLHAELANYIAISHQRFKLSRELHKVIISINDGVVHVDNDTYKRYLDDGNTQEVLLGMAVLDVQDNTEYAFESIIAKKAEYTEAWLNKVKLSQYSQEDADIRRHRAAYDIVLLKVFEDEWLPKDLKEFITLDYQQANKMFKDLIQNISRADELDIGLVVRELFGQVLFKDTNFKRFADGITDHVRLYPDAAPSDAATFASLEFIIGYLLDQIKVDVINGNIIG